MTDVYTDMEITSYSNDHAPAPLPRWGVAGRAVHTARGRNTVTNETYTHTGIGSTLHSSYHALTPLPLRDVTGRTMYAVIGRRDRDCQRYHRSRMAHRAPSLRRPLHLQPSCSHYPWHRRRSLHEYITQRGTRDTLSLSSRCPMGGRYW